MGNGEITLDNVEIKVGNGEITLDNVEIKVGNVELTVGFKWVTLRYRFKDGSH